MTTRRRTCTSPPGSRRRKPGSSCATTERTGSWSRRPKCTSSATGVGSAFTATRLPSRKSAFGRLPPRRPCESRETNPDLTFPRSSVPLRRGKVLLRILLLRGKKQDTNGKFPETKRKRFVEAEISHAGVQPGHGFETGTGQPSLRVSFRALGTAFAILSFGRMRDPFSRLGAMSCRGGDRHLRAGLATGLRPSREDVRPVLDPLRRAQRVARDVRDRPVGKDRPGRLRVRIRGGGASGAAARRGEEAR